MQDIFAELRREDFSIVRGFLPASGAIGLGRQMDAAAEAGAVKVASPPQLSSR